MTTLKIHAEPSAGSECAANRQKEKGAELTAARFLRPAGRTCSPSASLTGVGLSLDQGGSRCRGSVREGPWGRAPCTARMEERMQGPGAPGRVSTVPKEKGQKQKPQPGEGAGEQRGQRRQAGGCPAGSPSPGQTETRKRRSCFQRNCLKQKPRAGAPAHLSHGAALSRQGASSFPALPTFRGTFHDSAFDAKRSLIWHHLGTLAAIRHMGNCP